MPLFGKKQKQNMTVLEVVDFSNDTWSYKGEVPVYQIQSDGFSYDVKDSDGNDKNAISLGIAGMLIIVLNAKSDKIREDELLPHFGKVIKTRNWHSMTKKEANFLVQTAIKKLTSSATSGDVFDLASYAPLEVKRVLLKTLFTISRSQLKPEYREEAEHRIIDDIVPDIFANPEYELALLTGLIVKPDKQAQEPVAARVDTSSVLDPAVTYGSYRPQETVPVIEPAPVEPDSAFAELQKIYGRRSDTIRTSAEAVRASQAFQAPAEAAAGTAAAPAAPAVPNEQPESASPQNTPQPANPFAQNEPKSIPQPGMPNFSAPKPNNPFAQAEPRDIPQTGAPNFGTQQPVMPYYPQQKNAVPQPPMPNFGQVPNNPFMNQNQPGNPQWQNPVYSQGTPYTGNIPPYPGQMRPMNPQMMGNPNQLQQPYPGQVPQQNQGAYPQNFGMQQNADGKQYPVNPGWMNRPQPAPQQPQQPDDPTTANA